MSVLKSQFTVEPCVLWILHISLLEQGGKEMRSVNVFVFRLASYVERKFDRAFGIVRRKKNF